MKFWQSTALAALAVGIAAPAFAAGGTVSYVCQQGKQVDVSYQFNSRGKPVSARARLNGSNRNMAFDARRSDSTGTAFKDRAGYNLTGPVLTASNYRSEEGISILSPRSEFLYKDCNPRQNEPARQAPPAAARSGSVAYVCQQGRRLNVNYHFNSAGVQPQSAPAVQPVGFRQCGHCIQRQRLPPDHQCHGFGQLPQPRHHRERAQRPDAV